MNSNFFSHPIELIKSSEKMHRSLSFEAVTSNIGSVLLSLMHQHQDETHQEDNLDVYHPYNETSAYSNFHYYDTNDFDMTSSGSRMLLTKNRSVNYKSPGMIAWYCFMLAIGLPFVCCILYCWFIRWRSYRRAQFELDWERRQQADRGFLSRIEANVQAFSDGERHRRTKIVRSSISKHVQCITEEDIVLAKKDTKSSDSDATDEEEVAIASTTSATQSEAPSNSHKNKNVSSAASTGNEQSLSSSLLTSTVCNVCLEPFQAGDRVAKSSNPTVCRHVFHEQCIVSWFVTRSDADCPCCRQEFATIKPFTLAPSTPTMSCTGEEDSSTIFTLDDNAARNVPAPSVPDLDAFIPATIQENELLDMNDGGNDGGVEVGTNVVDIETPPPSAISGSQQGQVPEVNHQPERTTGITTTNKISARNIDNGDVAIPTPQDEQQTNNSDDNV